jgi:hypothetical protein
MPAQVLKPALLVASLTTLYAIVRYVVAGDVAAIHVPAFILNKGLSFAAAILLLLAALKEKQHQTHHYGRAAWHLVILHSLLSLSILSAAYYPKFFDTERLNLNGELLVLLGVLNAYAFYQLRQFKDSLRLKTACSGLLALHLIPMGSSWFSPSLWQAFLPPISLLSFLASSAAFLAYLKIRSDKSCH